MLMLNSVQAFASIHVCVYVFEMVMYIRLPNNECVMAPIRLTNPGQKALPSVFLRDLASHNRRGRS